MSIDSLDSVPQVSQRGSSVSLRDYLGEAKKEPLQVDLVSKVIRIKRPTFRTLVDIDALQRSGDGLGALRAIMGDDEFDAFLDDAGDEDFEDVQKFIEAVLEKLGLGDSAASRG